MNVGVFAGSHDSYYAFSPFMDKVIESYHGHKPTDKHVTNMDYKQLRCPNLPADEDKMINSTRIRVARNLAAYPLGTHVTAKERKEIENHVVSALNEFEGEFKGQYFSLEGMTESVKK